MAATLGDLFAQFFRARFGRDADDADADPAPAPPAAAPPAPGPAAARPDRAGDPGRQPALLDTLLDPDSGRARRPGVITIPFTGQAGRAAAGNGTEAGPFNGSAAAAEPDPLSGVSPLLFVAPEQAPVCPVEVLYEASISSSYTGRNTRFVGDWVVGGPEWNTTDPDGRAYLGFRFQEAETVRSVHWAGPGTLEAVAWDGNGSAAFPAGHDYDYLFASDRPIRYVGFIGTREQGVAPPKDVTVNGRACALMELNGMVQEGPWKEAGAAAEAGAGLRVEYSPRTDFLPTSRETVFGVRLYNDGREPVDLNGVALSYWLWGGQFCPRGSPDACTAEERRYEQALREAAQGDIFRDLHTASVTACSMEPLGNDTAVYAAADPRHVVSSCENATAVLANITDRGLALETGGAEPTELYPESHLRMQIAFNFSEPVLLVPALDAADGPFNPRPNATGPPVGGPKEVAVVELTAKILSGGSLPLVMDEELDYSYKAPGAGGGWVTNERVPAYVGDALAWGNEPVWMSLNANGTDQNGCPLPEDITGLDAADIESGAFTGCSLRTIYCCSEQFLVAPPAPVQPSPPDSAGDEGGTEAPPSGPPPYPSPPVPPIRMDWWGWLLVGTGAVLIGLFLVATWILFVKLQSERRKVAAAAESLDVEKAKAQPAWGSGAAGAELELYPVPERDEMSKAPSRARPAALQVPEYGSRGALSPHGTRSGPLSPTGSQAALLGPESSASASHRNSSDSLMISDVAESPRPQEALGNYLKRIGARLIPDARTEPLVGREIDAAVNLSLDVDKIVLTRAIGSGAHGNVYRGVWHENGHGMSVAVKVLNRVTTEMDTRPSEGKLSSLRTEVEVLSRIKHPHIVNLYGACLAPPHCCLIEELMEGSLADVVHRRPGRMAYRDILRVANQVSLALAYIHPTIVHRDLKPQNILVDVRGNYKVADFGIARFKSGTYLATTEGTGTPAYMAPELFGPDNICEKVDVYSLGVVLWECLTGRIPWKELEVPFQIVMLVGVEHRRLAIPADCPEQLRRLIERCWDKDPRRRPSCAELERKTRLLLEELDAAEEGGEGGRAGGGSST